MLLKILGSTLLIGGISLGTGFAQTEPAPAPAGVQQPPIPAEEIIRRFAAREKEFKTARASYVYRQDVRVQELNASDRVIGEYHLTSDILFDSSGRRTERVVFAPQSTLRGISMTPQDLQDIRDIQPFVLTTDDVGKYKLTYAGKETIDEVDCYVFEVEPKVIEKNQRYFQGRIWVDDLDFQIVKTYGKAVPDIRDGGQENLFPRFETYREQIDDYWFPTYTRAVDTLKFSSGARKIRQVIRYENYRKFQADVKLTFGEEVESANPTTTAPATEENKAPALDPRLRGNTEKK
jgi:hypothetical protein